MREGLNESGVSEVVGTVLLIALVVLGVAVVAAALLSQPRVTEVPHASIVAGENASGNFVLVHEGGDALAVGEYRVYVGEGTDLKDETANFTAPVDGVWSLGENITYKKSGSPERVVVTAVTGSGETILAEPAFSIEQTTTFSPDPVDPGTGGGSVTPGGGNETSPVFIVIPELGTVMNFTSDGEGAGPKGHYYSNVSANATDPDIKRVDFIMYDYAIPPKIIVLQPNASWDPVTEEYQSEFEVEYGQIKDVTKVVVMAIAFNDTAVVGQEARKVNISVIKK